MERKKGGRKNVEIRIRSDGKVTEINYLKGFSIITIALMHLLHMMPDVPSRISTLASIGGTGVHVFFFCSGIGLYLSYLKRRIGYVEFLKRRFIKIYIPYIIVIIVSFFLPWMYAGGGRITALASHVFLFKMFVPRFEESFGTQFWFISTLVQLYLLFIPMCLFKQKVNNNKAFFGLCLGISACWWVYCYTVGIADVRIWSSFCLQYIWEFALGFVVAEGLNKGKIFRINNVVLLIVAVAGIGIQAGMAMTSGALKVLNDVPALFGYTALALLLMNSSLIDTAAIWLSTFSYEFYLVHILVFETLFYLVEPKGLILECMAGSVALIGALAMALVYHRFMRKIFKLLGRVGKFHSVS